ncbi:MAG: hypothetical protein V1682_04425 [Candidatus Omnitrophota bacterium]
MPMRYKIMILAMLITVVVALPSYTEEEEEEEQQQPQQKAKGLDMVSDTVTTVLGKANALLAGKLELTMSADKPNTEDQFTTDAIGRKVPKSTAINSAGSLHNDQPL